MLCVRLSFFILLQLLHAAGAGGGGVGFVVVAAAALLVDGSVDLGGDHGLLAAGGQHSALERERRVFKMPCWLLVLHVT